MEIRALKFRGKSLDTGKWIYGYGVVVTDTDAVIIHKQGNNLMQHTAVDKNTVGQFIGITDKHGKDIYEGDIVTRYMNNSDPRFREFNRPFIVCYYVDGYAMTSRMIRKKYLSQEIYETPKKIGYGDWTRTAVIGNVYDDPELVKKT